MQRRIEVYVERDLPDLRDHKARIAEVLTGPSWQIMSSWKASANAVEKLLEWIGERLRDEWPDVARRLQFEQTGTDEGWFTTGR